MDTSQRQLRGYVVFFWCMLSIAIGIVHMKFLAANNKQVTIPLTIWSPQQIEQFHQRDLEQLKYDNMQIACITYALYGESRDKKQLKDTIGVAHVIMNRTYRSVFPNSPCDVVIQRHQFEPLAKGKRLRKYADLGMNGKIVVPAFIPLDQWNRLNKIAEKVYQLQLPDPTNGATHFWSPSAQRALGRKAPKWSYRFQQVASLGDHRYHMIR